MNLSPRINLSPRTGLSVEFVGATADIPEALWDACFPPPLEGRWWYQALERCGVDDQFTFRYGLITQDGQAVGVLPAFVMDVPISLVAPEAALPLFTIPGRLFPSLLRQRTLFAGSPCSDEGRLGLLPGVDRRAALLAGQDALEREARRQRATMIVWKDFPDAAYAGDFAWLAQRRRLFSMPSFPGAVVTLPSSRKEDYFAQLKGSRRHNLKKKLRHSAEAVEIDVEVAQRPGPALLDAVFGLFWQTYENASIRFERLNRRFFDLLAAEPVSHFVLLRERGSGDLVAFMLCFALGDLVINKFIGIDYARPEEWLLYFRLWEAALDWSLGRGAAAIQSGQTGYAPKIEIGHALTPMSNHARHRNWLVHRIYAAVAGAITWSTLDADLARYVKAHPDQGNRLAITPTHT
jgi:hypothetical protein